MTPRAQCTPTLLAESQRRLEAGETLKAMAPDLGVSPDTLGRWRRIHGLPQAPKTGCPKGRRTVRYTHIDLAWVEALRIGFGMMLKEIAPILGVSTSTLENRRRGARLPHARRGHRRGARHRDWKGGRILDRHGYVLVHLPQHPRRNSSGYVREHRLVMEAEIGRALLPREVVHHIDGNPANNGPDNLELFASNAEHLAATNTRQARLAQGRQDESTLRE